MRALLLALTAAVMLPSPRTEAQEPGSTGVPQNRVCTLRVDPTGVTRREGTLINILDPFRVTCNDGANLRATSGTFDQLARVVTLSGDVYFEDATRSLTSDQAVYDNLGGVLHATGNVVFIDRVEGTTLTGPELEYFRANEQRPQALVNAYGRPRLTMARPPGVADTSATPPAETPADTAGMPLTIDADRMTIVGENDLTAIGNVVIEDDDIRALADEAEQRGSSETLELRGNASIHSQEYSLSAQTIFATTPEGAIREVEAREEAELLGEDLNVHAPQLNLLFEDNLLQRTIALSDSLIAPGVRPLATSPTFRLEADSIDATLPGQKLEVVVAIGDARGEMIDTTRATPPIADSAAVAADTTVRDPLAGDSLPGVRADSAGIAMAGDALATAEGGLDPMFAAGDSVVTASAARLVRNDWITGDTITGYFTTIVAAPEDSVEVGGGESPGVEADLAVAEGDGVELVPGATEDAAVQPAGNDTSLVMERLVAVGAARSLYHVAPEEGSEPGTLPGINFLSAARIELSFADGQVAVAEVTGLRRGLYLEPRAPPPAEAEGSPEGEIDPTSEESIDAVVDETVEPADADAEFPEALDADGQPETGGVLD